ncbi:MAG: hypothetical protein AVDCRST_MAG08-1889, partial [uncultured Acetobacteraceae bacterium]
WLARYSAAGATSSARQERAIGWRASEVARGASGSAWRPKLRWSSGVSIAPCRMAFTRTPSGAKS